MSDKKTPADAPAARIDVRPYVIPGTTHPLPPHLAGRALSLEQAEEILSKHEFDPNNPAHKTASPPMAPDVRLEIKAACNARAWHLAVARRK